MAGDSTPDPTTTVEPSSSLDREAIRRQFDRILASPEYHATDKTRAFLRLVVEEKLAGRGEDFDATSDPIVRIQAGRLRRSLERYYLVAGDRDPILIDIPKGGYVPRFVARPAATTPPIARSEPSATRDPKMTEGLSAAVLGKLGRIGETRSHVDRVIDQKPDFAGRARELIRRGLKVDAVVDDLIDGLRKVGLTPAS